VLGVRDGVANDVLEEHLEHAARLLVNEVRDTLHTATTSETTNCGLRDTLCRHDNDLIHAAQAIVQFNKPQTQVTDLTPTIKTLFT
jgi:hypothetical protein